MTILAIDIGVNVGIASAIVTIVIILISEVIPKSIAATFPDKISKLVYPIIHICVIVLKPITILLNKMTDGINHLLSRGQPVEKRFSKEEIRTLLNIAGREGAFNEIENTRLQNVMDFEQLKVKDVDTTPRINVVAFSKDVTYDEAYDTVMNNPYTRYPVYDENIDDIIGVFHSKYLLSVSRKHLAIVLDEFGGTDAIVSHEDLIEELLGMDIEDEMDREEENKLKHQKFPQSMLHR